MRTNVLRQGRFSRNRARRKMLEQMHQRAFSSAERLRQAFERRQYTIRATIEAAKSVAGEGRE